MALRNQTKPQKSELQVNHEKYKGKKKTSRKTIKESQILVKTLSTLLHFTVDPQKTTPDPNDTIKPQNKTKQ